jgi:hypothetical protein
VIHEVDEGLRELLKSEVLRSGDVDVVLEAPTKEWAARRNAPTVNMYLYDIREDMRRKSRGRLNEYDEQGKIAARHMPPRYIKLSYLLTAWTQRPEDEHRLLSALLMSLLSFEALPKDVLSGSLLELGLPVPISVALPPPEDRAFADVWTALGGELKPSLDVVISAPVESGRRFEAAPIASEGVEVAINGDDPVHHAPALLPPPRPAEIEPAPALARHVTRPAEEPRVAMRRTRREPKAK